MNTKLKNNLKSFLDRLAGAHADGVLFEADGDTLREAIALCDRYASQHAELLAIHEIACCGWHNGIDTPTDVRATMTVRGVRDMAYWLNKWAPSPDDFAGDGNPDTIAEHLRGMLADGTTQCPLCGETWVHTHSPRDIVIYRNGIKYGRSLADLDG